MVAIVSGNSLGLSLSSLATLGQRGQLGAAGQGRSGEQSFVNIANGNLVLQGRDDVLMGRGPDVNAVRTYNSQGLLSDDNGDNWSVGAFGQKVVLTSGTAGAPGSTLTRTDRDGAEAVYTWDAARSRYVSPDGAGAFDTIAYDSGASQFVWIDGETGRIERYQSSGAGRLVSVTDTDGNTISYAYNGNGTVQSVTDANGDVSYYDYSGTNLTQIRTVSGGVTTTTVHYAYDNRDRLYTVTVDLSPGDNSVSGNDAYVTTYTYDGNSQRVATVTQSDGTALSFTYVQVGGAYKVATVTDALGGITRFGYDTAQNATTVTDPLGAQSVYLYDAQGQLIQVRNGVTGSNASGLSQISYAYDASGNVTLVTDGEGHKVALQYDDHGNLTREVDSAGDTRVRTYNGANQLLTDTIYADAAVGDRGAFNKDAALPETTRYVYAAGNANRLRFAITPQGNVTEYRYDAYGQRVRVIEYAADAYETTGLAITDVPTEAQLNTWAAGRVLTRTEVTELTYDARGQLSSSTTYASTAANGSGVAGTAATTQYIYDQRGLLLQKIEPATIAGGPTAVTTYTYDGLGRVLSISAPSLDGGATPNTTITSYDDTNGKTRVTIASGLVTVSAYDKAGRLVSVTQQSAGAGVLGATTYAYDKDGNLLMTQDPTGVRKWMLYDEAGRKIADIDATGAVIEYVYNTNGQLRETVAYATKISTANLVDGTGKPTTAWSATNTTTSLAALRPAGAAQDQKVWRFYDTANRLAWQVDALGYATQTTYDGASRILSVTQLANPIDVSQLGNGANIELLVDPASVGGITLGVSAGPSPLGSAVTLTATIDGTNPGGMVTFFNGETVVGSAMVVNGKATLVTNELPIGVNSIRAGYSGNVGRPASVSAATIATVTPALTTVNLSIQPLYGVVYGTPVKLSASLETMQIAGLDAAAGVVSFYRGTTLIGTATAINGVATLMATLPAGSTNVRAEYAGDVSHASGISTSQAMSVAASQTTTTLQVAPSGAAIALSARVSTTAGMDLPSGGPVIFYNGATLLGTATISNGVATLLYTGATTPAAIKAVYAGDANTQTSNSFGPSGVASPSSTSTVLSASATSVTQGSAMTLTARVAGAAPGGLATFFAGNQFLGTAAVVNGQAVLVTNYLPIGASVALSVAYGGDANNAASFQAVGPVVQVTAGSSSVSAPATAAAGVYFSAQASVVAGQATPSLIYPINRPYANPYPGMLSIFDGSRLIASVARVSRNPVNLPGLTAGAHNLTFIYSDDTGQPAEVLTQQVTATPAATALAFTSPSSSTAITQGSPFTASVSVRAVNGIASNLPAGGTVTFYDHGVALATVAVINGVATWSTPADSVTGAGMFYLTASYSGDANFSSVAQNVAMSATQIVRSSSQAQQTFASLSTNASSATFGSPLTLTASVIASFGHTPTGTVNFYNGKDFLGSGILLNGQASLVTSQLPIGTATLRAEYVGDADDAPSVAAKGFFPVAAAPTSSVLEVSATNITQGQSTTLTLTVAGGVAPGGTVSFFAGTQFLGSAGVVDGRATLITTYFPIGSDIALSAAYSGDANNSASVTAQATVVQVAEGASSVAAPVVADNALSISGWSSYVLTGARYPLTVVPSNGPASSNYTGAFSIFDGQKLVTSFTNPSGASVSLPGLSYAGQHQLTIFYSGDATHPAGKSAFGMTTQKLSGSIGVYLSTQQATQGTPVTITATVTPPGNADSSPPGATGTMTFYRAGTVIGTASVVNGTAVFTTSDLPLGGAYLTASYSGDTNYTSSPQSSSVFQSYEVVVAAPTASTTSLSTRPFGETITSVMPFQLVANVSVPVTSTATITGTVNFYDGTTLLGSSSVSSGQATFAISGLSQGTHTLKAVYVGDANSTGSTSTTSLTVYSPPATPSTLTNLTPVSVAADGALSVRVNGATPSGLVSFYEGGTLIGTASVTDGVATLSGVSLPAGTHTFVAAYAGDARNLDSEASFTQVVEGSPVTTIRASLSNQDRTTTQLYNRDGRLQGMLDAEGYLTEYKYDAADRLTQTTRYSDRGASFDSWSMRPSTANFETVSTRLSAIAIARASYDLKGLRPTNPYTSSYNVNSYNLYDAQGRIVGQVDGEGYLTESVYDKRGNVIRSIRYFNSVGAIGSTATLDSTRPASYPRDQITTQEWDNAGQLIRRTNPEGTVTLFAYNSVGQLVETITAAGTADERVNRARYDIQGRLIGELDGRSSDAVALNDPLALWTANGTTHTYDASGRRTSSTDANGHRTMFFYDPIGRLRYTVNALGGVTESKYNALGQLHEQVVYGTPVDVATFGGTAPGGLNTDILSTLLDAAADPTKDTHILHTYNATGTQASSTDGLGSTTSYSYNAFREVIASSYALKSGYIVTDTSSWDRRGLNTQITKDVLGAKVVQSKSYDAFGRPTGISGDGYYDGWSYDRLGRVIYATNFAGQLRQTTYDAFDRVVTQRDGYNNTTVFSYSDVNRSVTVTTPEGVTMTTVRNRQGQTQSVTDGRGNVTSYAYDKSGNLIGSSAPLNVATGATYDKTGLKLSSTDANGVVTTYAYDAVGRLLTRTLDPAGLNLTTTYAYDAKGQAVAVTDPRGVVTTTAYDLGGQVVRQTVDPSGLNLQTVYAYDTNGTTLTVTSPNGTLTRYTYDGAGRRVKEQVDPNGLNLTRQYAYDNQNRVIRSTDANGNITRFFYAGLFTQPMYSVDALGNLTANVFDSEGRVIQVITYVSPISTAGLTDASTSADVSGRVNTNGAKTTQSRRYDRDGRLSFSVDGTGAVVEYKYDKANNVIEKRAYANRINLASWNLAGDPPVVTNPAGDERVRTVYDALNRATWKVDGAGNVTQYAYDSNGNIIDTQAYATALTSAAFGNWNGTSAPSVLADPARDQRIRTVYDTAGRATWSVDALGNATQFTYDADGNVVTKRSYATPLTAAALAAWNGKTAPAAVADDAYDLRERNVYDAANRLTWSVNGLGAVSKTEYDANGNVTRRIQYATPIAEGADPASAATSNADRITEWVYDGANRKAFQLDRIDRVTSPSLSFAEGMGALRALQGWRYDGNGNVTSHTRYLFPVLSAGPFTYEALVNPAVTSVDDQATRMAYDAAGRLSYQVDGTGAVTGFTYDGTGSLTRQVAYATRIASAALPSSVATSGTDRITVFAYDGAGRRTFTVDALGGVTRAIYDAFGSITQQVGYAKAIAKPGPTTTYTEAQLQSLVSAPPSSAMLKPGQSLVPGQVIRSANGRYQLSFSNGYLRFQDLQVAGGVNSFAGDRLAFESDGRLILYSGNQVTYFFGTAQAYLVAQDDGYLASYDSQGVPSSVYGVSGGSFSPAFLGDPGNDRIQRFAYDLANRQVFAVDAQGGTTESVYDGLGQTTESRQYAKAISATGLSTTASVSDIRARITADAANDRISRQVFDAAGRVIYGVDALGFVTKTDYDGLDQVKGTLQYALSIPLGTANTAAAIATAVVLSPDDRSKSFAYDAAGRVLSADTMGLTESWTYDVLGNKTSYTNAKQAVWTYAYDRSGRMVQETSPQVDLTAVVPGGDGRLQVDAAHSGAGSVVTRLEYDPFGNLYRRTEAVGRPEERSTAYVYDQVGRQIKVIYPPVGVYTPSGDTFAVDGLDSRHDTVQTLYTETTYDALGNAIANRDIGGNYSYKTYDLVGRMAHEVDALGYVTGYERNAFGDATKLTRYGAATGLSAGHPASLGRAQVQSAVDALVHDADRTILTDYDRLGRGIEVREAAVYVHAGGSDTAQDTFAGKTTRNTYNTFGELTQVAQQKDASTWTLSTNFYDRRGKQTASVDALGYLTTQNFDMAGNITMRIEYAKAVSWTGTSNLAGWTGAVNAGGTPPTPTNLDVKNDRRVDTVYDRYNRKVSETRKNVEYSEASNGISTRGDLTTSYGYDAVGNLTSTTDAKGAVTYSYYDALGRVTAVAEPTRTSTETGAAITPLTVFRRDAHGNVVLKTEYVNGADANGNPLSPNPTPSIVSIPNPEVALLEGMFFLGNPAAPMWGQESTIGYIASAPFAGSKLLYRGVNTVLNKHYFTTDEAEWQSWLTIPAFQAEAPVGYVATAQQPDTTKLYRLQATDGSTDIIFTTSLDEANALASGSLGRPYELQDDEIYVSTSAQGPFDSKLTRYFSAYNVAPITYGLDHLYVTETIQAALDPVRDADLIARTDRTSFAQYDALGHTVQSTDAMGVNHYSSYNNQGLIAKEWQGVTDNAGATRTLFRAYQYDALGQQTHVLDPGTASDNAVYTDGGVSQGNGYVLNPKAELTPGAYGPKFGQVIYENDNSSDGTHGDVPVGVDMTMDPGKLTVDLAQLSNLLDVATAAGFRVEIDYITPDRPPIGLPGTTGTSEPGVPAHLVTYGQDFTDMSLVGTAASVDLVPGDSQGPIGSVQQIRIYQLGIVFPFPVPIREPAPRWQGTLAQADGQRGLSSGPGASGTVVDSAMQYNAFGELVAKSVNGQVGEYFDYDKAGRLWRTNAGDGVDKIALYDLQGRQTADIRSAGTGRGDINLRSAANAAQVAQLSDVRRTDTTYDLLGRVVETTLPERQELQGGVSVRTDAMVGGIAARAVHGDEGWSGTNTVNLGWNVLGGLGSGEVSVKLYYIPVDAQGNEGPEQVKTKFLNATEGNGGASFSWNPTADEAYGGIGRISRVEVAKKDLQANWQTLISQNGVGYVGQSLQVDSPDDPNASVQVQYRVAGSNGTWNELTTVRFGDSARGDLSGLALGSYEYQVITHAPGQPDRPTSSGTFDITLRPLTTFGVAGVNGSAQTLEWQGPGAGDLQTIRVRAVGGDWSGPWDITRAADSDWSTINISGLGAGQYEYEVLWTHPGEAGPYAHATGQINKVAGVPGTPGTPGTPDIVVPPSPPALSGLEVVTALLHGGGVQIPAVKVPLPDPSIPRGFAYRVKGSDGPMLWSLNIIEDSTDYEFGYADLSQVSPGTYEFIYYQGFPTAPLAWATGDLYYLTGMFEPYSQIVSTTPPEAPGYTIPGTPGTLGTPDTPAQYGWSATDSGPYPISQDPFLGGRAIGQNAGDNNADRSLRPTVLQNVDRWGNVVSITDPRSTSWKTTYSYNANNQMVLQVQTDEDGNLGADASGNITNAKAPVTRLYYDAMGRQVAVRDANDHVNGQEWDSGGNLVRELHADSGVISNAYDAFGNKVRTIDAENRTTSLLHDKLDRLVRTNRGAGAEASVERQSWDQAGRKLSQTNGAGNQIRYDYDLRGNLIRTTQPLGQATQSAYDALNHKTLEMDANGSVAAWRYDYFGQLQGRTDIGKASYTYTYDNARQLLTQTNSRGQHLDYGYDAAGQLVQIVDSGQRQPDDGAGVKVSSYAYDLSGRRTRETTVQDGVTYQDNRIAYDALGRMRWVADTTAYVNIDYDKVGNRTYVGVHVNDGANGVGVDGHLIKKHYAYDEMNRQTMVDAQKSDDGIWTLGAEGHRLTYYKDGTRKSDTHESDQRVLQVNGQWTPVMNELGETEEVYTYDSLGRLKTNTRDGATIDTRTYDGADRVLMSGIVLGVGGVDGDYINAHNLINGGPLPADLAGGPLRGDINTYDDNGRLIHQISNSVGVTPVHSETTYKYDDMGNMTLSETSTLQAGIGLAPSSAQRTKLVRAEGYEATLRENWAIGQSGLLGYGYDANGYLVRTSDAGDQLLPQHRFVNDAQGNALYAYYTSATDPNTPYNGQRQLVVNGEVLGRYGQTIDQRFPLGNPFLPGADMIKPEVSFSFGYQPIDGSYPAGSPGVYAVQTNDTLQSIAKGAYGDGNLWYLIADANGLMSNADLRTGQVLTIPTRVTGANNVNTFKPYDPSKIANDTPTMLAGPQGEDGGCGAVGQIIVAVVAVVVTVVSYGALSELGYGMIAAGAASGAAGSVASQTVGIAIGTQNSFSWKGVALGAVGGAVSGGLGASGLTSSVESATGSLIAGRVVTAALGNTITQGIAVATGLQDKFSWRSVAASAVSAGVSQGLNEAMNYNPGATGFEWGKSLVSGVGGSLVGQAVRGGKISAAMLASDAFGNVIGDSLAWANSSNNSSSRDYMNQMDRASYMAERDPLGGLIARHGGWRGVGNVIGDAIAAANLPKTPASGSATSGSSSDGYSLRTFTSTDDGVASDDGVVLRDRRGRPDRNVFYHQTPDELRGDRSKELPTVTIRADRDEPLTIDASPESSILEKGWQAYSGAMAGEFNAIKDVAMGAASWVGDSLWQITNFATGGNTAKMTSQVEQANYRQSQRTEALFGGLRSLSINGGLTIVDPAGQASRAWNALSAEAGRIGDAYNSGNVYGAFERGSRDWTNAALIAAPLMGPATRVVGSMAETSSIGARLAIGDLAASRTGQQVGGWLEQRAVSYAAEPQRVTLSVEAGNSQKLTYTHQLKADKITDVVDLKNQLAEHQVAMNKIIQAEGIEGLKARVNAYRSDPSIEAEGRAFAKAFGSADKGNSWLHTPDMATGGLPSDIIGQGSSRNNSILGGNANRIGNEILLLPPTTQSIFLEWKFIPF